jgi:tetratricopeptide (TPR) repeat protein
VAIDDSNPCGTTHTWGGSDPAVGLRAHYGPLLWYLGFPEQGTAACERSVAIARQGGHMFSLAWALQVMFATCRRNGEFDRADRFLDEMEDICERYGFEARLGVALIGRGISMLRLGDVEGGRAVLERGTQKWETAGGSINTGLYLVDGANSLQAVGREDLIEICLSHARRSVARSPERQYLAELARLSGVVAHSHGQRDQAEASFREALDLADSQGAMSYKLRAARDLARLLAEQGQREEARRLLAPVYAWFTEGFSLPDFKQAKALLDSL